MLNRFSLVEMIAQASFECWAMDNAEYGVVVLFKISLIHMDQIEAPF